MIGFRRPALPAAASLLRRFQVADGAPSPEALARLAEMLLHREQGEEEVVAEVVRWSDGQVRALLDACWQASHPETLALAEIILSHRGSSGLLDWIEARLLDPGGCRWLVDVLANVQDDEATRLLIELLDHHDASIRHRAADGIASHRSTLDARQLVRDLTAPLVRGLEHPDPLKALRALHRIADPALEPDLGRDAARRAERALINSVRHEKRRTVRGDAIAALGELGSRPAVRCLVDMLNRDDQEFHRDVVIALRKIQPDRAFLALVSLLQSRDPIVREEAAAALGEIGDPKAVKRIRDLVEDDDPDVRQEAVLALGKLGGSEVLQALERALSDPDAAVRTVACAALAESLGRDAQGKLIGALYDGSADVRGEAAYHLGNLGNEDAWLHLQARLRDRERDAFGDSVASIARKSLHRLALGLGRR